jgi:UDP-N-acetylmuramate dehydrogenase
MLSEIFNYLFLPDSKLKDFVELRLNEDLSKYSTMKLQAAGNVLILKNEEAVIEVLKRCKNSNLSFKIIGLGSNQIFPQNYEGIYLKLSFTFKKEQLSSVHDEYEFPASTPLSVLTKHAIEFGLSGWEVFTGIPASLGGAIFMNAGTELGEISEIVSRIEVISENGIKKIIDFRENETQEKKKYFQYRKNLFCGTKDIITKIYLIHKGIDPKISNLIKDYIKKRNFTQPMREWTCGCVFKNYNKMIKAGKYLDLLGLKGLEYKNLRITLKHGNFIENIGKATLEDFNEFIKIIQAEVMLNYGIHFELEIQLP